jgi:type I site-specific restriction-modification system R (restriction) subunit
MMPLSKSVRLWHSDDDDKGTIKVIMTGSSSDALNMQSHIRNKPRRKAIGDRLKNPNDPLKLVIVRDMWLTGFDAPCLHTLVCGQANAWSQPNASHCKSKPSIY